MITEKRFSLRPAWGKPDFWHRLGMPLLIPAGLVIAIAGYVGQVTGLAPGIYIFLLLGSLLAAGGLAFYWNHQPAELIQEENELLLENMLSRPYQRLSHSTSRTLTLYWISRAPDAIFARLIKDDQNLIFTRWVIEDNHKKQLNWEMPGGPQALKLLEWLGYPHAAAALADQTTPPTASLLMLKILPHTGDRTHQARYEITRPLE